MCEYRLLAPSGRGREVTHPRDHSLANPCKVSLIFATRIHEQGSGKKVQLWQFYGCYAADSPTWVKISCTTMYKAFLPFPQPCAAQTRPPRLVWRRASPARTGISSRNSGRGSASSAPRSNSSDVVVVSAVRFGIRSVSQCTFFTGMG